MEVVIDLVHVASGPFFLASGKTKPDKYRFTRVPNARHVHRLIIPGEKAAAVLDDLALRLQQLDIPVKISFNVEDTDRDSQEALTGRSHEIASLTAELKLVHEQLRLAQLKIAEFTPATTAEAKARITDDEIEMLIERDKMIHLLGPLAQDEETPVECLTRLLPAPPSANEDIIAVGNGSGELEKENGETDRTATNTVTASPVPAKPKRSHKKKKGK